MGESEEFRYSGVKEYIGDKIEQRIAGKDLSRLVKNSEAVKVLRIQDPQAREQQLKQMDNATLRALQPEINYTHNADRNFGCVSIYTKGAYEDAKHTDIRDPSSVLETQIGELVMSFDVLPFFQSKKIANHSTEAMYLISIDMLRALEYIKKRKEVRKIVAKTNPLMARFIVEYAGLHVSGGGQTLTFEGNQQERKVFSDEEVKAIIEKPNAYLDSLPADAIYKNVDLDIFGTTDEATNPQVLDNLKRIRDLMYRRLSGNKEPPTKQQLSQMEHAVRVDAINSSIEMWQELFSPRSEFVGSENNN